MSFSSFSSYLAKKNNQPRWGCIKGEKGDTGPMGPSGEQGIPGADASGIPVENFVFGWTGPSGNTGMTADEQYWLIPGGQVSRGPYQAQTGAQPPSMAVAYDEAIITAAATHITNMSTIVSQPLFNFKIYSFCGKIDASGIPVTDVSGTIGNVKTGCKCHQLRQIKAGCKYSLAVSVQPSVALTSPAPAISLSISLFSNAPLSPPS